MTDKTDGSPGPNSATLSQRERAQLLGDQRVDAILLTAARRVCRPRLLIDGNCKVLWASRTAAATLQPPLPLIMKDGELCTTTGGERGRAWADFIDNIGETEASHFIVGSKPACWILVRAWADRHEGRRIVFLECSPSLPLKDVESSGLAAEFSLTRAESSVLNLFARMMTPSEIANALGVSLSTVRSHLKQIHTKTSVNSSVHLFRIARAYCDR